jgi:hypothetical protein
MNIYEGLLFMQGHIASVELAKQLAETQEAPAVSMAADAASEGRPTAGATGMSLSVRVPPSTGV